MKWLFYAMLIVTMCLYTYAFVQDVRGKFCPDGEQLHLIAPGKTPIYGCAKP